MRFTSQKIFACVVPELQALVYTLVYTDAMQHGASSDTIPRTCYLVADMMGG